MLEQISLFRHAKVLMLAMQLNIFEKCHNFISMNHFSSAYERQEKFKFTFPSTMKILNPNCTIVGPKETQEP